MTDHASQPQKNDPESTWRLASYLAPDERRTSVPDRRAEPRPETPSRRNARRALRSLLRL